MHRPCAFAAVALIIGTIAGAYVKLPSALTVLCTSILAISLLPFLKSAKQRASLIFVIFTLFGWSYFCLRTSEEAGSIITFTNSDPLEVDISGRVDSPVLKIPTDNEPIYRFDLETDKLYWEKKSQNVAGKIRIYITRHKSPPDIEVGNIIRTRVRLYPLNQVTNPGQTDYSSYYKRRDICARAYTGRNTKIEIIKSTTCSWPRRTLLALRRRILESLQKNFATTDADNAALLGTLLVGERTQLANKTQDLYFKTGTVHFLALSGLHVAIFGFFLWWILALLPLPRKARIVIVMAGLVFYCLMGGGRISLIRATIMGILYLGSELFWRQRDTLNIIGTSAVIIIIISPEDIFSLGFQLSFVAVLSISAFMPLMNRFKSKRKHLLLRLQQPEELTGLDRLRAVVGDSFVSWAFLSFSAWLGVAPLIAYHFHIVTPFSILINIIISPGIWALLVLGFITTGCSLMLPGIAFAPVYVVSLLNGGIKSILQLFSSDFFYFFVPNGIFPPVSLFWLIVYYIILTGFALRLRHRGPNWRRIGITVLAGISLYIILPWQPQHPPGVTLTALDVGHGSTFVFRSSDGTVTLYDCGGENRKIGEDIIAPYLWHEGITSIDTIFLSHPDFDHICALPAVLERFRIGAIVISPYFETGGESNEVLNTARSLGVPVITVTPGMKIKSGSASFEVLAPLASKAFNRNLSDNDTSLIVRAIDKEFSVLFTGDAESCETSILLDSDVNLQASVLIIPHHGGKNPLINELLQATCARFALVSGGRNSTRIIGEIEPHEVRLLLTKTCGAIKMRYHEGRFFVKSHIGD